MIKELKRFVEWLKERTPCADCKQFHISSCMEFDHVPERGSKLGTIGQFVDADDETGLCSEIDKCEIVCVLCHRYRTSRRGFSEETRQRMSEAQKGRKLSKKTRAKMREAQAQMRREGRGPYRYLGPSE